MVANKLERWFRSHAVQGRKDGGNVIVNELGTDDRRVIRLRRKRGKLSFGRARGDYENKFYGINLTVKLLCRREA